MTTTSPYIRITKPQIWDAVLPIHEAQVVDETGAVEPENSEFVVYGPKILFGVMRCRPWGRLHGYGWLPVES